MKEILLLIVSSGIIFSAINSYTSMLDYNFKTKLEVGKNPTYLKVTKINIEKWPLEMDKQAIISIKNPSQMPAKAIAVSLCADDKDGWTQTDSAYRAIYTPFDLYPGEEKKYPIMTLGRLAKIAGVEISREADIKVELFENMTHDELKMPTPTSQPGIMSTVYKPILMRIVFTNSFGTKETSHLAIYVIPTVHES